MSFQINKGIHIWNTKPEADSIVTNTTVGAWVGSNSRGYSQDNRFASRVYGSGLLSLLRVCGGSNKFLKSLNFTLCYVHIFKCTGSSEFLLYESGDGSDLNHFSGLLSSAVFNPSGYKSNIVNFHIAKQFYCQV